MHRGRRPMTAEEVAALATAAGLTGAVIALDALTPPPQTALRVAGPPAYPASMIKTPLAVAVALAVDTGRLGWEDRFLVTPSNETENDAPSPLTDRGATPTIAQLVELMISRSDNVATNMLIDAVGRERATADLAELGFPATAIRRKLSGALPLIDDPHATGRNAHPAEDAVRLFAGIAAGDVPGAAPVAAALAKQVWNAKLSAGLAPGDRFAHKTGDTDDVSHDGGILTLANGSSYALAVYTTLPSSDATDARFAAFMRALRPLL